MHCFIASHHLHMKERRALSNTIPILIVFLVSPVSETWKTFIPALMNLTIAVQEIKSVQSIE